MRKGKDKEDPRGHYGEPPETWLWDLYPLAEVAWGNILGFNDGLGDGNTIDMRLWLRPGQMSNYPPPVYRPAHAPLPPFAYADGGVRRCYIPQAEDLELVGRVFPTIVHAGNPPWPRVEAELIAAGRSRDELAKMNAPTLLLLLAQTRGATAPAAADDKRPRCAPMSRAEIARRLLNKPSARTRDALALMQRHGLRQEPGSNLWTIYVDKLGPITKDRLLKPAK